MIIPNSFSLTETLPEYLVEEAIADEDLFFQPSLGEMVKINTWIRYPDYDWLFGVPTFDSPRYAKEEAFYIFRNRTNDVQHGFYLDKQELTDLIMGLLKIQHEKNGSEE